MMNNETTSPSSSNLQGMKKSSGTLSSPNVVRYSQQDLGKLHEMTIVEMDDAEPTTAPFPNTTDKTQQQEQQDATPTPLERTSVDFDQFMETHSRLFRSRRTMAIINSIPKKHEEPTVGYGDITPVTAPGRIIAIMTILSGIMIMALPSMAIGGIYGKLLTEFDTATDPANREKQEERKEAEDDGIDLDLDESEKEEQDESKQKSWLSVDDILFGNQPQSNSFGDLGDWSKLNTKEISSVDESVLGKMVVQQELLMQACVQQMEDMKQVIQELEKNL
ncbi:predicted protein [Naegleria gruberi]|uniref:Predicted protein n=1 Tax=Naegleria gruberi TaxID=5762 RepID=D2VLT3_NAEGR|nr:uncharacterized protein NAEGRDRAFT_50620 [Naegleria gruberi]EFC42109.1 predicted protein [Naegleria gruberi]|eukprot:XP_002674853.1 predicted protein [Naegleria gruberi strain NEG-M]